MSRVWVPRHVAWLVVDYFAYTARLGASARRAACRRLLRVRRASGCLGTSRGSLSTTLPTLRNRVPRHVARLVALPVVNYFAYAARPGASARRAARRRLLHLRRATRCLSTSRGSSCGSSRGLSRGSSRHSSSTTSPTPRDRVPRYVARLVTRFVIDYFAYATRPGTSAPHAAHHAARCQLLCLRRASGCLGTSRGSSLCSSSTTLPTPCVWVPRHVARLVMRLVDDYSMCRDFVLRPHWLYFSHTMRRDYLSRGNTGSTSSTPRAAATSSSGHIALTIHLD
jgi:hypothetical protein